MGVRALECASAAALGMWLPLETLFLFTKWLPSQCNSPPFLTSQPPPVQHVEPGWPLGHRTST